MGNAADMAKSLAFTAREQGALVTIVDQDSEAPSARHAQIILPWDQVEPLTSHLSTHDPDGNARIRNFPVRAWSLRADWEWVREPDDPSDRVPRPLTRTFTADSMEVTTGLLPGDPGHADATITVARRETGDRFSVVLSEEDVRDMRLSLTMLWVDHLEDDPAGAL